MKIDYDEFDETPPITLASEIPVGTVFSGSIMESHNSVFLKGWGVVVDLEQPRRTWDELHNVKVNGYREFNARLVIEGYKR